MHESLISLLRCPVTRSPLQLRRIAVSGTSLSGKELEVIEEGILFSSEDWFYPVIGGIPRLLVESFLDHGDFLQKHLSDYETRKANLLEKYGALIDHVVRKNKHTKQSFSREWGIFNYDEDKTWNADHADMLKRFLRETDEDLSSIRAKRIFDAGCGNGLLNQLVAASGAFILGMDFSESIERAYAHNREENAMFIQGDVQFPPVAFEEFDIVHSSGVLICTNNSELSFSCIEPCVKKGGKLSVWLYHPRKDLVHNLFNFLRRFTSPLPVRLQYYLYLITLFPVSYVVKRMRGNKQNAREMMIDILDWFSPRYRWEHKPDEAGTWFYKRNYTDVKVTTTDTFGFNIIGRKKELES